MINTSLDHDIKRAKSGDKHAFGQIYSQYFKKILKFSYFSLGDYQTAQDITQNTFLKAWMAIKRFSLKSSFFQAYLYRIAKNLIIDYYRSRKKLVSLQSLEDLPAKDIDTDTFSPQLSAHLSKAINSLSKTEQNLIYLRYFRPLSYRQISLALGKTEGSLRVAVSRALHKLKPKLSTT